MKNKIIFYTLVTIYSLAIISCDKLEVQETSINTKAKIQKQLVIDTIKIRYYFYIDSTIYSKLPIDSKPKTYYPFYNDCELVEVF